MQCFNENAEQQGWFASNVYHCHSQPGRLQNWEHVSMSRFTIITSHLYGVEISCSAINRVWHPNDPQHRKSTVRLIPGKCLTCYITTINLLNRNTPMKRHDECQGTGIQVERSIRFRCYRNRNVYDGIATSSTRAASVTAFVTTPEHSSRP